MSRSWPRIASGSSWLCDLLARRRRREDSRVTRQRQQRGRDGRRGALRFAETQVAARSHSASDRLQCEVLDLLPKIDKQIAEADQIELTLSRRRLRREDVVPTEPDLLAQLRTHFEEAVAAH